MKYTDIMNNDALTALRNDAFTACREYAAHINDTVDTAEVERLKGVVALRISKYTDACKAFTFKAWLDTEKPVLSALMDGVFPTLTMKVKGKKGAQTTSIEDDTRVFNVTDFISFATENGYDNPVHDKTWLKYAEEAHKALCGYLVAEMNSQSLKSEFLREFDYAFKMKAGSENCGEADFAKRYSKGNIDRTLQALFDAILFDDENDGGKNKYRIRTHNRNTILYTYAKKDSKTIGKVLFSNLDGFMKNVTDEFAMVVRGIDHTFDKYPVVKAE